MQQRQAAEPLHQFVRPGRGEIGAGRDARVDHRLLDRILVRRRHHRAEPEPKGEKIAQRDRSSGGDGIVERTVDGAQHLAICQLRQPRVDRLVEPKLGLLDQDHGGRRCDRLGHGGDAEDGVAPHRLTADRLSPDHVDVHLAPPADQRDETGHFAAFDIAGHDLMHAAEPRLGQSPTAHRLLPPSYLIRP
jgi:hypothetical protein